MVTHPLWVQEFPGSYPALARVFMFNILFVLMLLCFYFFVQKHIYLSQHFAIPFVMLIYLVDLDSIHIARFVTDFKEFTV